MDFGDVKGRFQRGCLSKCVNSNNIHKGDYLMHEQEQELVSLLAKQCTSMEDVHNLLKSLFKGTLEEILETEMDEHLGYPKHDVAGNNSGNSRNGYGKKTIQTELGETELKVPRDRKGTFAPQIVEKRQTKSEDLESRIIAMNSRGRFH